MTLVCGQMKSTPCDMRNHSGVDLANIDDQILVCQDLACGGFTEIVDLNSALLERPCS
jgi:hypothetical protein